jgi:hypothetical protein
VIAGAVADGLEPVVPVPVQVALVIAVEPGVAPDGETAGEMLVAQGALSGQVARAVLEDHLQGDLLVAVVAQRAADAPVLGLAAEIARTHPHVP